MICFIKDRKSFTTTSMATAVDFEIHDSIYDTVSRVTIPTPESPINEGDFVLFDGVPYVGIVSEVEIDGGTTEISVKQGVQLFSREMFFTPATYTYLEDHLKDLIDTNYTNCSDAVYKLPFLSVTATTHTSGTLMPDIGDATTYANPSSVAGETLKLTEVKYTAGSTYSIASYISKMRRVKDIVCDWSFTNTVLKVDITQKSFPTHNIDMSNPSYKITEQTFSDETVGKLTVYCEEDGNYYTRYLKDDGTITSTYSPTGRVDGEWKSIVISELAELNDAVADEFALNYYSHKLSFMTDKNYGLYDKLMIRINGKVFSSYISGIITRKGSKYREIECGELQTQYPFLNRI